MFDSILLSFDTEFTHPVPRLGALMQLGVVATPMNLRTNTLGEKEATFKATFRVEGGQAVKDWVLKNQGALLSECMLTSQEDHERRVTQFREWLSDLPAKLGFDEPVEIMPYGWCTGSDVAYLLDLLGPYHEMVSYRTWDLKPLLTGRWAKLNTPEAEVTKRLGVPPLASNKRHDALEDAKFQLELFRALLDDPEFRPA